MHENVGKFIAEFESSLKDKTFVKAVFGNYRGSDENLQKLSIRLIETKKGIRLFFLYRYNTRDTAKNYSFKEGAVILKEIVGTDFQSAHLFTIKNNFQLEIIKGGKARLSVAKPTFKTNISATHDREKKRLVNQNSFYLNALGVTDNEGKVRDKQQNKWKQINKFVEIMDKLVAGSALAASKEFSVIDMGAGKGYLTFALYDYFKNIRGIDVNVIGVDTKSHIVGLCNEIAASCEFNDLKFVESTIDSFELQKTDILIALHACNTATDDAIYKGIKAKAELIIVAPCCHQQLRPQMKSPPLLKGVLKHGVLLEREAEQITDGIRSLLLEESGYSSKVFEFISTEHTPKNNMIVGTRQEKEVDKETFRSQIAEIKEFYGIREHRLDSLINGSMAATQNQ